jgi:hypothetical protein
MEMRMAPQETIFKSVYENNFHPLEIMSEGPAGDAVNYIS